MIKFSALREYTIMKAAQMPVYSKAGFHEWSYGEFYIAHNTRDNTIAISRDGIRLNECPSELNDVELFYNAEFGK